MGQNFPGTGAMNRCNVSDRWRELYFLNGLVREQCEEYGVEEELRCPETC